MARARNVKPSLFKNELLGQADPLLTLLFVSLWTLADKEGRLEDRPLRIKVETFPYRDNIDINGYLTQLVSLGFIWRYEVDGTPYIQVIEFVKHQSPHNTEKASIYPECPAKYRTKTTPYVLLPLNNESGSVTSQLNVLIPDSLNTDSLIPDSPTTDSLPCPPATLPDAAKNVSKETELQEACRITWTSYSDAFFNRYGTEPVRNAKVNSQVKAYVQRIGFVESPLLAAWFIEHTDSFYVRGGHTFGLLEKDCEKLRTEWATGRRMNSIKARQAERVGGMAEMVNEILSERGVQ